MNAVLLVDDLPAALGLLEAAVCAAFPQATRTCARSAAEAIRIADAGAFDLALVDLSLPDGRGEQVIAHLARCQPGCTVVVATIHDDDDHLFPALQAGAQGYLLKDQPGASLARQLAGIAQGQPPLSPAIARRLLRHFRAPEAGATDAVGPDAPGPDERGAPLRAAATGHTTLGAPDATPDATPDAASGRPRPARAVPSAAVSLSAREREVLVLLAQGERIADIAARLGISRHTAGDHVKSIYRKLEIDSRAQAALRARGLGLV